jgi:hypothetical protein
MISPQETARRADRITTTLYEEDVTLVMALLAMVKDGKDCIHKIDWCGGTSLMGEDSAYSGKWMICTDCAEAFIMESNARYLYERMNREWQRR